MWKIVYVHRDEEEVIVAAMNEGFEPFSVSAGRVYLKKQVQSDEASIEAISTEVV